MSYANDLVSEQAVLLAAAFDASPAACIITDGGVVLFANAEARRLFKCPEGTTVMGRGVNEIVHPDGLETMRARGEVLAVATITLRGLPVKLVAIDGSTFTLNVAATPVDHEGRRVFMFTAEL
jgi:PAS domain S-box-containing protein